MALKTYGTMGVDWEQRIDFDRLRKERLARAKSLLAKSSMGAVLCTVPSNGSTNQSVSLAERMVSSLPCSMCQATGTFCQVRLPGTPLMAGSSANATPEV